MLQEEEDTTINSPVLLVCYSRFATISDLAIAQNIMPPFCTMKPPEVSSYVPELLNTSKIEEGAVCGWADVVSMPNLRRWLKGGGGRMLVAYVIRWLIKQ